MNNYLLLLGGNFAEIRQLLNLTQDDLAKKMGVSRPTIVKIEQDPSRLTKTLAFAFFIAVSYEVKSSIKKVKSLDPEAFKSPDKIHKFVEEIKKSSWLSVGSLVTVTTLSLGLLPGIGAAIAGAAGAAALFKSMKKSSSDDSKPQLKWDVEKAKKIIEEIQKKLIEDQKKVLSCFQLNALEIEQFVERIEEGEIVTEVW